MKWYKASLEMVSWTASAWQADTIFGHLCWGLRYLHGEAKLLSFLEEYRMGSPPLLVSDGFPDDLLPRPLLSPAPLGAGLGLKPQKALFHRIRSLRGIRYVKEEDFTRLLNGEDIASVLKDDPDYVHKDSRRVTLKNQISRLTGTTGAEGQLFPFEEFRWSSVAIYLKVKDDYVGTAKSLFEYLAQTGYGKRKSVGYGQIRSFSLTPFEGFPSIPEANGFVSLSSFIPSGKDPRWGNWKCRVKYGKLGEEYALERMAFKRPLVMLEAGSTFYASPCREFYGRLVQGISPPNPQVVQYGFALPVPMRLPEPVASP